jgi:hypothetical protein
MFMCWQRSQYKKITVCLAVCHQFVYSAAPTLAFAPLTTNVNKHRLTYSLYYRYIILNAVDLRDLKRIHI